MTPESGAKDQANDALAQRLDKWLWFARIVKSRTLAASLITAGKFKLNRVRIDKPSQPVKAGDVITSTIKRTVRVLRVKATGERRGPASEAVLLYDDLTPRSGRPEAGPGGTHIASTPAQREPGAGRPTKRDRRDIDRFQGRS